MTVTDLPRTAETTPQSQNLARLREMLADESQRAYWPEVRKAIEYLTATSVLGA